MFAAPALDRRSGGSRGDLSVTSQPDQTRRALSPAPTVQVCSLMVIEITLQRNLLFDVYQVRLLSPVRKVRPMISLLSPPNKPNHHFNIKGSHRQGCS